MKPNQPKKRSKYSVTKKDVVQNAKYLSSTMMVVAAVQLADLNAAGLGELFTACGGGPNTVCLWGMG